MSIMQRSQVAPVYVALLSTLIFIPCGLFIAARLTVPGDGTNIVLEAFIPEAHALHVEVYDPGATTLQSEDAVLAIAGITVDDHLRALRTAPFRVAPAASEANLPYDILRAGQQQTLNVRQTPFPLWRAIQDIWSVYLYLLVLEGVSLFIFLQRPRLPAAQLFLVLSTLILSSGTIFFLGLQPSDLLRGWLVALWFWGSVVLYALLMASLLHFSLVFPVVRPELVRRPWLVLPVYLGVWLPYFALLALRWSAAGTPASRFMLFASATGAMTATYLPLVLLSTIYGYARTFNAAERRQARWVLWATFIAFGPWLILFVIPSLLGLPTLLPNIVTGVLWLAIPIAFAISILREGLFDIDVLINRTLVYGLLTASLLLVYFSSVVLLQALFRTLTGQESQLAVVLSTLAIAALFTPFRQRVQDFIDRRFYRQKYNAEQTLAAFALMMRDEVDLEVLSIELLGVVRETMQPSRTSLWLRPNNPVEPSYGQAEVKR